MVTKLKTLEDAAKKFEESTGGKPSQTLLSDFLRWWKEQEKPKKKS